MPAKKPGPADEKEAIINAASPCEPILCASTNLRMAARATTRLYDKALAPVGLTVTQYAILSSVFRAGEIASMELASMLCLERTTLYRALAVLERRSLVASRPGRGREQLLSLTPSGAELREAAFFEWHRVQKIFLAELGDDWDNLLEQTRRVRIVAERQFDEDPFA